MAHTLGGHRPHHQRKDQAVNTVGDEAENYLRDITGETVRPYTWRMRALAAGMVVLEVAWLVGFTYGAYRLAGWVRGAW